MSAVDIIFGVLVLLSMLWGFWRGLTRELVSLVAWVIVGIVAYRYASWLGHLIPFDGPDFVHVAAGAAIIVVAGVLLAAIIGRLLRAAITESRLAGADRVLGAVFGALRGCLVVLLLTWGVVEGGLSQQRLWRASLTGPYLEHVYHALAGTMPAHRGPLERVPLVMMSGD